MTTLKLGYTNPLTDAFGAHPVLGGPLDLNDGQTFTLLDDGLDLGPPPRTLVPTGNIRTQGERATRAIYRHNRELVCRLLLGPAASYAALVATLRTLVDWTTGPPQYPVTIQYQPPNASSPVYLDVVGAASDIPEDEGEWLRLQREPIALAFWCRPGLRGDRVTLQNLVWNPGYNQGSQSGVQVWNDPLTNANGYTTLAGSFSIGSNLLQLNSGCTVTYGSPSWGPVNQLQARWRWLTGLTATIYLHYTDANNWLGVQFGGTSMVVAQTVGGTLHTLASATATLTSSLYYWLQVTQFPTAPGAPSYVQATLFADSAGSIGAQVATAGGPTFDAVTALSGVAGFTASGAIMNVGGAFSNVLTVALFGPGGWLYTPQVAGFSATGQVAGAWEQNTANTYGGGPIVSQGAARLDVGPAGTVYAQWNLYSGGVFAGSGAIPVKSAGDTLGLSAWVRSTGLSSSAHVFLFVSEYNAQGTLLRTNTASTVQVGNASSWTQLTGSYVTGASCAYVDLAVRLYDLAVAGESAGGTLWVDNVQCWDATAVGNGGAVTMPYCELRFPASPAQLVVSGLLGDLPAPAACHWGTYLASLATGASLTYALARAGNLSATAILTAPGLGYYGPTFTPQAVPVLDATAYGGYYEKATVSTAGWNPRGFSPLASDAPGVYHILARYRTQDASPTLVQVRARVEQTLLPWYQSVNTNGTLGIYYGPYVYPLSADGVWTIADAGQAQLPPFTAGALTDPTQTYLVPRADWVGTTGGGAEGDANWLALLPVDGALVLGVLQ